MPGEPPLLAEVALPVPVARSFTYLVPAALASRLRRGARVACSFGSRRLIGVVLAFGPGTPPPRAKPLLDHVDDGEPTLPEDLLDFLRELASYYLAPIGEAIRLALPAPSRHMNESLREPTLFPEKARGLSDRKVQWAVVRADAGDVSGLRGQALAVFLHVRDRSGGAAEVAGLSAASKSARAAVASLEKRGFVRIEERAASRASFFTEEVPHEPTPELTTAQTSAVASIESALTAGAAATFLLHGVTGSGKTEVYLASIAAARSRGRGAIVLVPEIALTPQLVARYRGRFGNDVAIVHSGLTPRERHDMWRRMHDGELLVAIGARSALFAPIRGLGLVIVDEEHDPSFKQDEGVRYHARDMAILRAHRVKGVVVLGSATPSLETEHLTRTGRAVKLRLPGRARAQSMPRVERVDLRRMGAGPTGDKRLSLPLHRAIEETVAKGEQVIVFLNRRGFAPSVRCVACGELAACGACSVALTFHKKRAGTLACHYCGFTSPMRSSCAKCGAVDFVLEGLGTEKLEESIAAAFPHARVARLDRDVAGGGAGGASGARAVERVLGRMRAREIDILVGTQMVAKGHDLPHVTLVGVINADAALSIPDFRASERGFQLLVQVAGRAGRGDAAQNARVLLQTYDPDQPAIAFAAKHDVDGFLDRELEGRRELGYPPYSRIALVRVEAVAEVDALQGATHLAAAARAAPGHGVDVLGPAPAPLARLRNRFRFRVMLRGPDRRTLRAALTAVGLALPDLPSRVRVAFDVDPIQLL